jgi:hypothetical protein
VGIESLDDLLADLSQAFDLAAHPGVVNVRSVRRRDTADGEGSLALPGGGGSGGSGDSPPQSPVHWEDAASVAKTECVRLSGVNAVLRERLMQVEAASAALEARWRAAGGAPPPPLPLAAPPAGLTLLQALGVALAAAAAVAFIVRRP